MEPYARPMARPARTNARYPCMPAIHASDRRALFCPPGAEVVGTDRCCFEAAPTGSVEAKPQFSSRIVNPWCLFESIRL